MPISADQLVSELTTLRKGAGFARLDLNGVVGPGLRELCAIKDSDTTESIRRKLSVTITRYAEPLPDELALAVTAALGLGNQYQSPLLAERIALLAGDLSQNERTIRRRMDEGFHRLAALAVRELASAADSDVFEALDRGLGGWRVHRFNAVLRLDTPTPECLEQRRIVAEIDGLSQIVVSLSLPRVPGATGDQAATFEIVYGGILVEQAKVTPSRFAYRIDLPKPLARGEEHDYALSVRLPKGQPMRPHYVFVPEQPCEEFGVHVRFAKDALPETCWMVERAFHRDVDDSVPTKRTVRPDLAGEVAASFRQLAPGFGYGLQWTMT